MIFKDHPLKDIVAALQAHADVLAKAHHDYLVKEAERKWFDARLVIEASGKSHAERLTTAQASDASLEFHKVLARLESIYHFHKLKHDVLDKEYFAQAQALKLDEGLIKKQV